MKRLSIGIIMLVLTMLICPIASATYASAGDAQAAIDAYYATLPIDETDQREIDLVYPEDFGGMYVDEDNYIVVCIAGNIESAKQFYIDAVAGGDADLLRFVSVEKNYDLLDQYYVTIGARHVSTKLNIINMYKVKSFEINSRDNRVDIRLYAEEQQIDVLDHLHGIFGDGIYIYFTSEDGSEVLENEDDVYARTALEEQNAPPVEVAEESTVSEQVEEAGISVKNIVIPVVIVVLIIVAVFVIAKIRSRNTDLEDDEDI